MPQPLDFGDQGGVAPLVDVVRVREAGRGSAAGDEKGGRCRRPALLFQQAGQFEGDGGAHAVAEQGQRAIGPAVQQDRQQAVGQLGNAFHARLGTPGPPPWILHREYFYVGGERSGHGDKETRRSAGMWQT